MIGKGKSIAHGGKAIDYVLNKEQAEVIDKRLIIGENGREIEGEFGLFQELNHQTKNNSLSFVLSPEPKEGKQLTNSQYRELARKFLSKMGLSDHQAIVVKHQEKAHSHLHIIANRIDHSGKAYKDSFIGKKSQRIADQVAQEKGLTRAKVVEAHNKEISKSIRQEIYQKHQAVLQHKPIDFKSYTELMRSSGVEIQPSINKSGKLQGFRLAYGGNNFKASEVHRSMTLSKIAVNKIISNLNPKLKVATKIIQKGRDLGLNL